MSQLHDDFLALLGPCHTRMLMRTPSNIKPMGFVNSVKGLDQLDDIFWWLALSMLRLLELLPG